MTYSQVNISSGHSINCQGMSDVINEVTEAKKVVDRVYEIIKANGKVCYKYHDTASSSSQNLANIVNFHNQYKDGVDVSVHFNANVHTDNPMGVEVCYYSDSTLASQMSKAISDAGGFKNRGAKQRTGLYFLKRTNKLSILIEVCFGDSTKDCELYRNNFEAICQAIAKTLIGDISNVPAFSESKSDTEVKNVVNITTTSKVETKSELQKAKEYVGDRCKELQTKLIALGYNCGGYGADSQFGQGTYNSLMQFQKDNGLDPDGLAGVKTFAKLDELIAKKTSNSNAKENVKKIQRLCNSYLSTDLDIDGLWGAKTESAVKRLPLCGIPYKQPLCTKFVQEVLGVSVDGIYYTATANAVYNFQRKVGLSPDKIVGFNTYKALATK